MPPPRGRGRPPLDEDDRRSVAISVRVPSRQYDALYARARETRITVPELLRRAIRDRLQDATTRGNAKQ